MKDESRNSILFAVIAALILFGWPYLSNRFFPTANPPATMVKDGRSKPVPNPGADPTADSPGAIRDRRQVLWGSAEDSELKAQVVDRLLAAQQASSYDVSVPGNPTYRP